MSRHFEEVALSSLSRAFGEDSDEEEREEEEDDNKITKLNDHNSMHTMGVYADMIIDGPEIGTLIVYVDQAMNLLNRKSFGKQRSYCAARLGKEVKKTENDQRGGQTPIWYAHSHKKAVISTDTKLQGPGAALHRSRLPRLLSDESISFQWRQGDRIDWGNLGRLARSHCAWRRSEQYLALVELQRQIRRLDPD